MSLNVTRSVVNVFFKLVKPKSWDLWSLWVKEVLNLFSRASVSKVCSSNGYPCSGSTSQVQPLVYTTMNVNGSNRVAVTLHWCHNDHDGVSNHQPHGCWLNRLFRHRSKKTSEFRVTGLCVGNSPGLVNSPHKGPVTRKMFPFDDVIMTQLWMQGSNCYRQSGNPKFYKLLPVFDELCIHQLAKNTL